MITQKVKCDNVHQVHCVLEYFLNEEGRVLPPHLNKNEWLEIWVTGSYNLVQVLNREIHILGIYNNGSNALTFDEFLALAYPAPKPSYKEVNINESYTAKVSKDGIHIGCQTFSHDKLDELVNVSKEFRNEN